MQTRVSGQSRKRRQLRPGLRLLRTVSLLENDALAWTVSNQSIVAIPPLDENQIVYTTAYDANIVAQAGKTTLVKTMAVDTRNKVVSQSNVKADTGTTFILTADGGNIAGSENLLIDGAADLT